MAGFYAEFHVSTDKILHTGSHSTQSQLQKLEKQKANIDKAIAFSGNLISKSIGAITTKASLYTGNKIRANNIGQTLKLGSYAITAVKNPYLAIGLFGLDTINAVSNTTIRLINSEQETEYRASYYGKMATSGSRWRGDYR